MFYNVSNEQKVNKEKQQLQALIIDQSIPNLTRQHPTIYVVQKNDSLYSISAKFNIPVQTLIDLNGLDNNVLNVGQTIKLQKTWHSPTHVGQDICKDMPLVEDTKTESQKYDSYIVQPNDSLYNIAAKFHTDVGSIKYINDLENNVLLVGQVLKIPKLSTDKEKHSVQNNESLYTIAKLYGITTNDIIQINKLKNDNLTIGQTLIIPKKVYPMATETDKNHNQYIVKSGDSLYKIAKQYNTTVEELMNNNNLHNTILTIGQVLNI